ncbi:EAL domain-containing protein [Pseudoroseicyclus sp. H15]
MAGVALTRAELALAEAEEVLLQMRSYSGCSEDHIAAMRHLVMGSSYVDEVGYFENGELACTSWGMAEPGVRQAPVAFTLENGIAVSPEIDTAISESGPAIALQDQNHNVLISHFRLTDTPTFNDIELALGYRERSGQVYLLGGAGTELGASLEEWLGSDAPEMIAPEDVPPDLTFARTNVNGRLVALASSPQVGRAGTFENFLRILLPAALIVSLLLVVNIIWLSRRQLKLDREILSALRHGEMRLVYQPIIDLSTGQCRGAEALLRWQRPDGEYIRPDQFIPVAEERGIIGEITRWVVARAIEELTPYLKSDAGGHVAINLSAGDIASGAFPAFLASELDRTGLTADKVMLEVTERGLIAPEASHDTFAALSRAGHHVAIDDFGTGYSSLQYLQNLPINTLKIDKSFVSGIGLEAARGSVVEHIIDLGHSLDLIMIAEGIETRAQAEYLIERGVLLGQGYLFSRPLECDEFLVFAETVRRQPLSTPPVEKSA